MNISSTRLQGQTFIPPTPKLPEGEESTTFWINLDPFSGIKDGFRRGAEEVSQFAVGALPGLGAGVHARNSFFRSSPDNRKAQAGVLLNVTGTVGAAVALGQFAFGMDPSLALGISAVALGGSGILHASVEG